MMMLIHTLNAPQPRRSSFLKSRAAMKKAKLVISGDELTDHEAGKAQSREEDLGRAGERKKEKVVQTR